ncbi:MAG: hypothetical protein KBT51_08885 [Cycloclasticus sp.]|nr:hypothetical protein [Cycloclasticus sp.]
MDFELLYRKRFTRKGLADYLEVTINTVKNWEATNKPPISVVKLLQLLNKDLSHLGNEWKGFFFHDQRLYTPENEPVQAGHIRAVKYYKMTIEFLKKDLKRLKMSVANLNDTEKCKVIKISDYK